MITTRPNLFDAGPVLVPDETDDLFSTDPLPTLPLQTPLFAVDDDGSDDAQASG